MKSNLNLLLKNLIFTTAFFFVGVAVIYAATTWSPAPATAPNQNVDAPINVGGTAQTREGLLNLKGQLNVNTASPIQNAVGFTTWGLSVFNGQVQIQGGSPGIGRVLTSSDSVGSAYWQELTIGTNQAIGSTQGTHYNYDTSGWNDAYVWGSITPTSNSSKILINASVVASSPESGNNCRLGLFRDDTQLVAPFATIKTTHGQDARTSSVTYVDTNSGTSARTYKIKANGVCRVNSSYTGTEGGSSTITVVEFK